MTRANTHGRTPPGLAATGSALRTRRSDPATAATTVQLPADPSGSALATAIREIRLAMLRGDVIVNSRQASGWSPGPRLVLDHLQRLTHRAGRHWYDLAAESSQTAPTS